MAGVRRLAGQPRRRPLAHRIRHSILVCVRARWGGLCGRSHLFACMRACVHSRTLGPRCALYYCRMPAMSLLGCSLLQYASSIVSYRILELVSHLTFTIVNVAKRLVLIVAGMLAAQRAPSITSSIGILMAVGGILAYNIVKDVDPKHGPPQLASLMSWVTWLRELVMQYNRVPHSEEEAPLQPSQSLLPMRAFANALSTSGYQPPGLH
ncbi:hypothetical protein EON66_10420, partial [archaeon]